MLSTDLTGICTKNEAIDALSRCYFIPAVATWNFKRVILGAMFLEMADTILEKLMDGRFHSVFRAWTMGKNDIFASTYSFF